MISLSIILVAVTEILLKYVLARLRATTIMDAPVTHAELPLDPSWLTTEEYVDSLLNFITSSTLFQNLCGGVHVLDFLTRKPDIYSTVLPLAWREWFDHIDVHDLLQILLRIPTNDLLDGSQLYGSEGEVLPAPPQTLKAYIYRVRVHLLDRSFPPAHTSRANGDRTAPSTGRSTPALPRLVAVGMKPKKVHEVANFAVFVSDLTGKVNGNEDQSRPPLRIVDFGSGQNYLGRTLASPPYNQHIIAIERKHHNVDGARGLDVQAKLAKKERILRNKKDYKRRLAEMAGVTQSGIPTPPLSDIDLNTEVIVPDDVIARLALKDSTADATERSGKGTMTHIEHDITSGELESLIHPDQSVIDPFPEDQSSLMTVSLHSCGNLTHHALRSILNPSVQCVAAIGCCYNLLTERLGPATYKHPQLHRSLHPRLVATSTKFDPDGFPMSRWLEDYAWTTSATPSAVDGLSRYSSDADNKDSISPSTKARGIRQNITARMMAVQAPQNWGHADSEMFFTRHFYRALLQKILLDCDVVKQAATQANTDIDGNSLTGSDEFGTPLIVGSLPKTAFTSFAAYTKAALAKLIAHEEVELAKSSAGNINEVSTIRVKTAHLTPTLLQSYLAKHGHQRKHLAIMWSLMAFSAGVVESLIAVDRWLWLKEQDCVEKAWVQTVFDYGISPRNLCVIGVKKRAAAVLDS